jgi:hypothetical protein
MGRDAEEAKDQETIMTQLNYINVRSVASAVAAVALTLTIALSVSWMFQDTAKLARAQLGAGYGTVAAVNALVR